ncbi:MAG: carboxypeptidase-like regulatory domain-containing protein [Prolixibacteraceae bacterium]|nr:carboxypeptidase-like regulatory domain-containing protein [Prolixibacteraceae bacterium]
MNALKNCIFILLLSFVLPGFAQDNIIDPMLIRLQAKIISAGDSSGVPYANIINNRTHSGTITNAEGYFSLEMLNIDSLIVSSVGYQKAVLKVPYNYNGSSVLVFVLKPMNYNIGEVEVQGEAPRINLGFETGKPTDIPAELRGDAFNEKPPVLAALFNPISFWQYHLSKREKQKREVRKAIAIEKNWEMHSKNYNKDMVMYLTGMTEPQADTFMVWFNSQDVLPYTSTEYEVRASILEYFEIYRQQGKLR